MGLRDPMAGRGAPRLAVETCRRRLRPILLDSPGSPAIDCDISWYGSDFRGLGDRGSEVTVQALSGLMEVHGWDAGEPRRLGLEVASVAAGILAANAILAAHIGVRRGEPVPRLETSVLGAGLLLIAHHIAAATATGDPLPSPSGPEPGPPFCTSDGRWFEIEVFDAEPWKAFWRRLGAGDADLGRAWTAFRARYYRGRCSLPPGLHDATVGHTLAEVAEIATACQVSLCPVRGYREVLTDTGSYGPSLSWESTESVLPCGPRPAKPSPRPLHGIRVVEATSRMQGPLAGLLLQMLGAEVIRVEPPGGDIGRMVPPLCDDVGSFFQCFNRGKAAVELDLTGPNGRAGLVELLAESDVFLHNWRPGRAGQWGLDRASVAHVNRRLVYAEASGWGASGDHDHLIGTDFLVQAYAGFGEGLNPEGEPPLTSRVLLTDCLGALVTCEGILAGLYLRESTGARGVSAGTSLLEGAMAAQAHVLDALAAGGENGRRRGRPVWGPLDRPLATADGGSLMVAVEDDADYRSLAHLCGVPLEGNRRGPYEDQTLAARIAKQPAEHWFPVLRDAGVPCAPVTRDLAALTADPRMVTFFQPLSETCRAPARPWVIT